MKYNTSKIDDMVRRWKDSVRLEYEYHRWRVVDVGSECYDIEIFTSEPDKMRQMIDIYLTEMEDIDEDHRFNDFILSYLPADEL